MSSFVLVWHANSPGKLHFVIREKNISRKKKLQKAKNKKFVKERENVEIRAANWKKMKDVKEWRNNFHLEIPLSLHKLHEQRYKDSRDFSFLHSSLFSITSSCRQKCCKHMFCKLSESWISSSLFDWWLIFGEFSKRSKKKWGLIVSSTKSFKITVEKLYELAIVFCDCFIVVWADLNKQALVTHSHHTTVKGRGIKSRDKVMQYTEEKLKAEVVINFPLAFKIRHSK